MEPQPFTPAGFQALQAELNQLSPQDLQTQANLIASDLVTWVNNNFTLDADQQAYLQQIDQRFINYSAAVTAFAVLNNLPVTLTVNGAPTTFKLIHSSDDIYCTYSPDGFTVTGGVNYEVDYQQQ